MADTAQPDPTMETTSEQQQEQTTETSQEQSSTEQAQEQAAETTSPATEQTSAQQQVAQESTEQTTQATEETTSIPPTMAQMPVESEALTPPKPVEPIIITQGESAQESMEEEEESEEEAEETSKQTEKKSEILKEDSSKWFGRVQNELNRDWKQVAQTEIQQVKGSTGEVIIFEYRPTSVIKEVKIPRYFRWSDSQSEKNKFAASLENEIQRQKK